MTITQFITYIRTDIFIYGRFYNILIVDKYSMPSNDIRLNNHNIFQLNNNESQERLIWLGD